MKVVRGERNLAKMCGTVYPIYAELPQLRSHRAPDQSAAQSRTRLSPVAHTCSAQMGADNGAICEACGGDSLRETCGSDSLREAWKCTNASRKSMKCMLRSKATEAAE